MIRKTYSFFTLCQEIIVCALPVLVDITVHEVPHGYVAEKLGDKTALILGRLSFNPLKHIDLIGTVLVPLVLLIFGGFIFGWAKPVPINPRNLKNPRRDMAIVSIAGPLSNFLMAIIWAIIMKLGVILMAHGAKAGLPIILMGNAGIFINLVLMLLNLIPIPPLDGSRIVAAIIPMKWLYYYDKIEPYGFIILILLIFSGMLGFIIGPGIMFFHSLFISILHIQPPI